MDKSKSTTLIIVALLGCLCVIAVATAAGALVFISQKSGGILPVTPTLIPTQILEILPVTATLVPTQTLTSSVASNFYMATDKDGTNQTNVFSPDDDFFVFFDVADVKVGMNFQSRWYALDVEGQDPNMSFQTIDYAYEEGITSIYFQMTSTEPWPVGNYKVEIYMDDVKIGEQSFSVK